MKKGLYRQLNGYDRARLEALLNQGMTQYAIAQKLGFNRSTISREVGNRGALLNGYKAEWAQKDYQENKKKCGTRSLIQNNEELFAYVVEKIKIGWSPEVISGRLKKEIREGKRDPHMYVNHESIYQFVFDSAFGKREALKQYLRRGKRRRSKRDGRKTQREIIPNRLSIEERPIEIETRKEVGHWEGDTIMYGKLKGLNSLVERKTRYLVLTKLAGKTPAETKGVVVQRLSKHMCSSLTLDNGIENRNHEAITEQLNVPVYFCHPYSSWEKGTNENTNGIVRRYLPKKMSIDTVNQNEVDDIAREINNRPRKVLEYASPQEELTEEYLKLSVVALNY